VGAISISIASVQGGARAVPTGEAGHQEGAQPPADEQLVTRGTDRRILHANGMGKIGTPNDGLRTPLPNAGV